MPNLKDKPRQSSPVPSNYLVMLVNPTTGATYAMPVSEFLAINVAPDTTPPSIVSKTAINSTTIRVVFSEVVSAGSIAGWSTKKNGTNNPIVSVGGVGTATLDFTVQNAMINTDTILISYNAATGNTTDASANEVVSITDSAVNNLVGGGGGGDLTAPVVTGAVVNNGAANQIVVSFDEAVNATTAGWSFKKNGSNWTISSVTMTTSTVATFTMATSAAAGDMLLRSYDSATGNTVNGSNLELASFTDQSITNNVSGDVTAPTVVSATVENANPSNVVVVFSESVTATTAGWSFKKNGSAWSVSSVSGSGTTWTFVMGSAAANGDTLLRSYGSGTGNTLDAANNELGSFTDASVTNNVASTISWTDVTSWPVLDAMTVTGNDLVATSANGSARSANYIAAGGDGKARMTVQPLASVNNYLNLGFDRGTTVEPFPADYDHVIFYRGNGDAEFWKSGTQIGTDLAVSTGWILMIEKVGSDVNFKYSSDGGSTWTQHATTTAITEASSNNLYLKCSIGDVADPSNVVDDVKQNGLS